MARVIWYTQGQTINAADLREDFHMPKTGKAQPIKFDNFRSMGLYLAPQIAEATGYRLSTKAKKFHPETAISLSIDVDRIKVTPKGTKFVRFNGKKVKQLNLSPAMHKKYVEVSWGTKQVKFAGRNAITKAQEMVR